MCLKVYKILPFLLIIFVNGFAQERNVPAIDKSLVKVSNLLWDLDQLDNPPEVEWTSQGGDNVQSLLYESVDYKEKPTQVFAWYSNPDLFKGQPASGNKFPAVVLVHGGGNGKAYKEWVEKWADNGYAAIAMDLSGNGPDGKKVTYPGPEDNGHNKFGIIEARNIKNVWSYHAVASVVLAHSLLLSLPEVDDNKTAITGISWGGYLTEIVASLDNRFEAAAPVYGCGYTDESDIFSQPLNQLSADLKQKWMNHFDPSNYLPFAQPQFLFLNGNKDKVYNVIPCYKTYSLIPSEQRAIRIKPDMKHNHSAGWRPQEIYYFFESIVNEGEPLVEIEGVKVNQGTVSLSYNSSAGFSSAEFYYSNDTTSTNMQRGWNVQQARINTEAKTVSSPVPEYGFRYAFFYLKDKRDLSVSTNFIIK